MNSGFLVEPGDVSDLAIAIKFLLDHSEIKNEFEEHSKKRFDGLFKDKIAINYYREMYNKLIKEIPS